MPPYGWRSPRHATSSHESAPDCVWLLERALALLEHLMEERTQAHTVNAIVRLPRGGIAYDDVEREVLLAALAQSGWVQRRAARLLRLSARVFNYKVKTLGLQDDPRWPAAVNSPRWPDPHRPSS